MNIIFSSWVSHEFLLSAAKWENVSTFWSSHSMLHLGIYDGSSSNYITSLYHPLLHLSHVHWWWCCTRWHWFAVNSWNSSELSWPGWDSPGRHPEGRIEDISRGMFFVEQTQDTKDWPKFTSKPPFLFILSWIWASGQAFRSNISNPLSLRNNQWRSFMGMVRDGVIWCHDARGPSHNPLPTKKSQNYIAVPSQHNKTKFRRIQTLGSQKNNGFNEIFHTQKLHGPLIRLDIATTEPGAWLDPSASCQHPNFSHALIALLQVMRLGFPPASRISTNLRV